MICYLFGEYVKAIKYAAYVEPTLNNIYGHFSVGNFYLYDSLAHLAIATNADPSQRKTLLKKVYINQKKLKKFAKNAPLNNLHKFYLVEAELCRILGKNSQAIDYYDKTIAIAKQNEYIHETALAYELAAQFYLGINKNLVAKSYMQEARYCYQLWGAIAKIQNLEKNFPEFFVLTFPTEENINTVSVTTTGSGSKLDIATVMKASQAISSEIKREFTF